MESITFNITNNAWINNGLGRLIIELETNFSEEVSVNMINNSVEIYSNSEKDVLEYISEIVSYLAAFGTYNFSTSFKLINLNSDSNYKPNCPYPKVPRDLETMNITKDDKEILKKFNISDRSTKQKIWKMRMSYLGSNDSNFKLGINFKNTDVFKKLSEESSNRKICPNCGCYVNNLIKVKRFFNPLMNEHHNNDVDGFGAFRKNISFCPKCVLLSYISLFDKYIPFYQTSKQEVFLALPNTYNV